MKLRGKLRLELATYITNDMGYIYNPDANIQVDGIIYRQKYKTYQSVTCRKLNEASSKSIVELSNIIHTHTYGI